MPRYIDADLILPEMESKLDMQELYLPVHFQEFIVDEILTADVAPVRHGYWIEQENWAPDDYYYTCSACGEDYNTIDGTPDYNFCPNCGAKMDGGAENAEHTGNNNNLP